MSDWPDPRLTGRVVGIGSAIALMVAAILVVGPTVFPRARHEAPLREQVVTPARAPIAAEADVFRMGPGYLATGTDARPRDEAHPRTLAMYRRLRAYPGAPPRIPHALSVDEFAGGRCNACHERGGFVERFAAYAPVTPHPEMAQCLQCHVPDDRLVGLPFPTGGRDAVCLQCHLPDAEAPRFVDLDWPAPRWPEIGWSTLPGAPPSIPHDAQLRGNCQACHVGSAAVDEIRTSHPERANCRQCHVPRADDAPVFQRAVMTAAEDAP
jgi:nitrate reductase (cytochrome), electron transfer subunit